MDPNIAQNEPMVIKTDTRFFKSFKFQAAAGAIILLIFSLGGLIFLQRSSTPSQPAELADRSTPKKGLIGIVEAVDADNSLITVKEKDQTQSYQVSNDVLISRIVLGVKTEEQAMKQFTLPTEILYLEDLQKKKGEEVYLVFDQKGKLVTQIQMYPNK